MKTLTFGWSYHSIHTRSVGTIIHQLGEGRGQIVRCKGAAHIHQVSLVFLNEPLHANAVILSCLLHVQSYTRHINITGGTHLHGHIRVSAIFGRVQVSVYNQCLRKEG